jgi:glycosidase
MQGNKDPFNRRCFDLEKGDKEILDWYKKLGKLRRKISALKEGKIIDLKREKGVFTFTRQDDKSSLTVVVNCGDETYDILVNGYENEITRNVKSSKITLNKYDFAIFYK